MAKILHLIEGISFGGAARGMCAAAKYSAKFGGHEHSIMPISLKKCDLRAASLAEESGMRIVLAQDREAMMREISAADIVHLNWWNSPDVDDFLRSSLPEMRLLGWLHVGGHIVPQVVTHELLEFLDVIVPTSPHALEAPAIKALPPSTPQNRVQVAYGPADFERLEGFTPKAHEGFNVGYIGTINFQKMHSDFVILSASVDVPDIKFVVCGSGGAEQTIRDEANAIGMSARFDVKGYVNDILPVLETMDAYGYPLCEDTYASSELNLQEVMFAGIPPVVFPAGGVKHLVINGVTGYIVHSATEYKQALEHLYHHPEDRARIGAAAKQYAQRIFGAENAARKFNDIYRQMLEQPKRARRWSEDIPRGPNYGAEVFVRSLGRNLQADAFYESLKGTDLTRILAAEQTIGKATELLRSGGIHSYGGFYPNDPYLWFWSALTTFYRGDAGLAAGQFLKAANLGFEHWRVLWYLGLAAEKIGDSKLAHECSVAVEQAAPGFLQR